MHPTIWGGDVCERVAPTDAAEVGVDERNDRVEVAARDGAKHEDDREQTRGGRGPVFEQLQTYVSRGEMLRSDPGADHHRSEKRRAEELGEQPSRQRRAHPPACASVS
jgi:hypothetical protein